MKKMKIGPVFHTVETVLTGRYLRQNIIKAADVVIKTIRTITALKTE